MTGRQVIEINKPLTKEQLFTLMNGSWDTEKCNSFAMGRPTPASIEEYIMLPATDNYLVIAYTRSGGIFSKKNKVILSVCDTPAGMVKAFVSGLPTRNVFFGAAKIGMLKSKEDERKGPAEEALLFYTGCMQELLTNAGY